MKVVLVAEAWGKREAQVQHALVGPSGRELTLEMGIGKLAPFMTMLCRSCKKITDFTNNRCQHCQEYIWPNEFNLMDHWKYLRREHEIHVTNVFNTRPPDNNLGHFFGHEPETEMPSWKANKTVGGSHLKREHFHHVQRLWRELAELKPNLVIALGNAACWAVLGQTKISTLRGTVNWSDRLGLKVLPTFHPAAVLRDWGLRTTVLADFEKASREAEFPDIRRPFRWITIPEPTARGLDEIRAWLAVPATSYSNDIETIRRQISIIGFARDVDSALVIPFRDAHTKNNKIIDVGKIAKSIGFPNGGINFWPTPELEVEAWKLAIGPIQDPRIEKIFQNGVYDMSYYIRMGIRPRNAQHDTMLWHHSRYPELPKSLGFLGSVYANDIAWKTMTRLTDSLKRDE